ncbi:hypothetical protein [Marinimicrobium agarilyticum]|uniref:hypothetical protein n=1 Tax=Marinimicrobium agarilyticum TaxID=306546 RepID=UPI0012F6E73D|nr:hypothetical protein [Marinimicrobium agarilyticum]
MENSLKKILLNRKFSSVEYMQELSQWHQLAIDSLSAALNEFYLHSSRQQDWHKWPKSDWPETWEQRVLENLKGTQSNLEKGIENYKNGKVSTIRSVSGSVHNIFRNLDNFGWGWWSHLPSSYRQDFNDKLVKASKIATNIMDTLSDYWKDDEILNERITGPIDEKDLRRYLKPGETL